MDRMERPVCVFFYLMFSKAVMCRWSLVWLDYVDHINYSFVSRTVANLFLVRINSCGVVCMFSAFPIAYTFLAAVR